MPSFVNKKTVLGAITGGLLILGGPTGIDLAFEDSIKISPMEERVSIYDSHIKEYGEYQVEAKDFVGRDKAVSYCEVDGCISFKPSSISWSDGSSLKNSPSILSDRTLKEKGVRYDAVFGSGFDMDIDMNPTHFSKVIKINSVRDLGSIPEKAETLDIYFEITESFEIEDGPIDGSRKISDLSTITGAKVWSSGGKDDQSIGTMPIKAEIVTIDDKRFLVKHIPTAWLKSAVFPISTDVDIAYNTHYTFHPSIGNAVSQMQTAEIGTNKFVSCWLEGSTFVVNCIVGTQTGGAITYGASTTMSSNDSLVTSVNLFIDVCKVANDKFAVVYPDDVQLDDGYVKIGSVSGTTITPGTALEFETGDMESPSCAQLDTDKIIISYNDETAGDQLQARACTVSGTTPTCGTINVVDTDYPTQTYVSQMGTDKFVIAYENNEAGNLGFDIIVGTVSGTTITMGSPARLFNRPADNGADRINITGMGSSNFAGEFHDGNGAPDSSYFFAGTTTGTTIGGLASSTVVASPTNGVNLMSILQYSDDVFIALDHENTGIALTTKLATRFVTVDWSDLSISWGSSDTVASLANSSEFSADMARWGTNIVVCYQSTAISFNHNCVVGSVAPSDVSLSDITNIASTTVTATVSVTNNFGSIYDSGFIYGIGSFTATSTIVTASTTSSVQTSTLTSLSTFKEYFIKGYASSTNQIITTDTYRFFTADISTSTPVVAEDNHAWDLSTFDDGINATTTTNGTALVLEPVFGSATTSTTTYYTTNLSDAGFCYTLGSCFTGETSGNARMGFRSGAGFDDIVTGFRFENIDLYNTDTIISANFIYTAQDTDATTDPVIISGEDTDNSPTFTTTGDDRPLTPFYGGLRATTTANTPWTLPNQTVGVQYTSPDITGVVQEVVNRGGWQLGNALSILVTDDGATDNHNADMNPAGLNELVIVSQRSYEDGYWYAPAWDLGSITNVDDSWIEFSSSTPSDSAVLVRTAVSTSSTTPPSIGSFATSTSNGSIAGISASDDLTGKYLWVRVDLYASSDSAYSPTLHYITYAVNQGSDAPPAGRRRILHTMIPVDLYRDDRELSMLY